MPTSSSTSVAPEQEATPAKSSAALDYWADRSDVVIRAHKSVEAKAARPERRWGGYPTRSHHSIVVTRCVSTNLENAGEKSFGNVWCGDGSDVRELSDFWIGETVFDKLRNSPRGTNSLGDARPGRRQLVALATFGPRCGS